MERRITTARAAELFHVDVQEARCVLKSLADRGLLETLRRQTGKTSCA